jgi:hypothetical protein
MEFAQAELVTRVTHPAVGDNRRRSPWSAERKAQARQAFREYATRFYQCDIGQLTPAKHSEALTRFYLEQIYSRLYTPLSQDDIEAGLVDGPRDLGVETSALTSFIAMTRGS